jgi:GDP-L-fucose synthase
LKPSSKIFIAGHEGMVGSAIHRCLSEKGYNNFTLRKFNDLDLIRQAETEAFFQTEKPEYVVVAAAKVGGIHANNTFRAQFIYENLMIQNNIIHSAYKFGVKKLLFLGSSCIYPKNAPQPLKEEYLLTGELEPTNEPYAIAKIAGIKMCENYFRQYGCNFISAMPTNLYGPNDNYNLETSHVLPAIIRKMHLGKCLETNNWKAIYDDLEKRPIEGLDRKSSRADILNKLEKFGISINPTDNPSETSSQEHGKDQSSKEKNNVMISLWGSGQVYREFMHVDDMASACVFAFENINASDLVVNAQPTTSESSFINFLNVGTGKDCTIKEVAELIKQVTQFTGKIKWDPNKPDGTLKKLLDVSILTKFGFNCKFTLEAGIANVYTNYIN